MNLLGRTLHRFLRRVGRLDRPARRLFFSYQPRYEVQT